MAALPVRSRVRGGRIRHGGPVEHPRGAPALAANRCRAARRACRRRGNVSLGALSDHSAVAAGACAGLARETAIPRDTSKGSE